MEPQTTDDQESTKRQPDAELSAMGKIMRALDGLDPDQRTRVGAWVCSRFCKAGNGG